MGGNSIQLPELEVLLEKYRELGNYRAVARFYNRYATVVWNRLNTDRLIERKPKTLRSIPIEQVEEIASRNSTLQAVANEIKSLTGLSCSREYVRQFLNKQIISLAEKPTPKLKRPYIYKGYKYAEYPISRDKMVERYNSGESAYDIMEDLQRLCPGKRFYSSSLSEVIKSHAKKCGIPLRLTRNEAIKQKETKR